ncbi:MAG: peptidoglycan DD-metalloendopeptidase family protein [Caulobacterales bacterium]|jgi:murein DD-endopeptidase MepM/ murein hydrolase activator NlpD
MAAATFLYGAGHAFVARQVRDREAVARVAEARVERAEHEAFTQALVGEGSQTIQIARGETLAMTLARAGVRGRDVNAAIASVAPIFNPRRVRPGQSVTVYFDQRDGDAQLTGFSFRSDPGASVTVSRLWDGTFNARELLTPVTYEIARVAGAVQGSLYESALDLGATEREVGQLADIFAYDVDFQRDIRPGDLFELVFERYADDDDRTVRTGDLLYVALTARGQPKAFYRYKAPGDLEASWYDPLGRTARKFLMKTPINGARLSSGFGMRRHPILGYSKMHRGTDFAASTGTPIMAAGDGIVDRAGFYGGYGRYVRLRHSGKYATAYGHMSGFARGLRPGARVRQGQVIGYVGSSGASTGPHLHYEVLLDGMQINPMSMRVPTGRNLDGKAMAQFEAERDRIDALRAAQTKPLFASAAPAAKSADASGQRGLR